MSPRILSGDLRGRVLARSNERGVRPPLARTRRSLLDSLRPRLPGARVLDVFAGSGSLAFECLSRGAASAVLVEGNGEVARSLKASIVTLGLHERARVIRGDAFTSLRRIAESGPAFELAFLDPPFADERGADLLSLTAPVLEPGGMAVLRHPVRRPLPALAGPLRLVRSSRDGGSITGFYDKEGL